ncbi:MFS transporter [Chloroflexota bacterium]
MLAHFTHHLVSTLPTPLLPFIRDDFTLDYTQCGLLISAFKVSNGISQLPAGWLADRIGPRLLITLGTSGVALAGLLVGLSPTYIMMVVFLALMGMLGGGYHPASAPIVTASVTPENQGRALGLHMSAGSSPLWIAPLIAAALAPIWGWRGTFVGLAIPAIMFGIILYIILGRGLGTKKAEHNPISAHSEIRATRGNPYHLVSLIVLVAFTQAILFSTAAFIPLFLVDHFGVSREAAAASLAVIFSAGLWVSPLGGYLSDRLGKVSVILMGSLVAGPTVYLLNIVPYGLGIGAVLFTIGLVSYIRTAATEAYIVNHTSEHNRSTILGVYYFATMGGGSIISLLLGYFIDQLGFYTTFSIISATIVVITLGCSILLWGSRD